MSIDHESIQACDHFSIHANQHLKTQVYIPRTYQLPQHSSKIVKAFQRTNVQLHNDLSHQAYTRISFQVCAHVYGYHMSEY